VFPATFANLLKLKNLAQEQNPQRTIFPTAGDRLGQQHARHRRAVHHAALAGGGVGDERAVAGHDGQPEFHPARAGLRRGRDARWQARHRAVPVHRHQCAGGPPGPECRGHEPRLRSCRSSRPASTAAASRWSFNARPPADRRQVRSPRGRARRGLPCWRATSPSTCRRSWRRPRWPTTPAPG
jgi:hypothetical protein